MELYSFVLLLGRVAVLVLQPSGWKLGGAAPQLCQLGVAHTSFLGVNALWKGLEHFSGTKIVYIWVYMALCSHMYMYLYVYTRCKYIYIYIYIYALYCTCMYIYLYLNASIYIDICIYRCILVFVWYRPISVALYNILLHSRSKGYNCQDANPHLQWNSTYATPVW